MLRLEKAALGSEKTYFGMRRLEKQILGAKKTALWMRRLEKAALGSEKAAFRMCGLEKAALGARESEKAAFQAGVLPSRTWELLARISRKSCRSSAEKTSGKTVKKTALGMKQNSFFQIGFGKSSFRHEQNNFFQSLG